MHALILVFMPLHDLQVSLVNWVLKLCSVTNNCISRCYLF